MNLVEYSTTNNRWWWFLLETTIGENYYVFIDVKPTRDKFTNTIEFHIICFEVKRILRYLKGTKDMDCGTREVTNLN